MPGRSRWCLIVLVIAVAAELGDAIAAWGAGISDPKVTPALRQIHSHYGHPPINRSVTQQAEQSVPASTGTSKVSMTMENVAPGLLLSLLAGGATALGALVLPFLPLEGPPPSVMAFALSLAAGVMIAISCEMLLLPNEHEEVGSWRSFALFSASVCIFAAVCAIGDFVEKHSRHIALQRIVVTCPPAQEKAAEVGVDVLKKQESIRLAVLLFVTLTLHNIPEGFAVAVSSASNHHFGMVVASAVALHNVPEGLSLAVATYDATQSRFKAILVPILAGGAEPLGALLSIFLLRAFVTEQVVHDLLVVVAGVMCYLSFGELLPAAYKSQCWSSLLIGCTLGFGLMFATHEVLDH